MIFHLPSDVVQAYKSLQKEKDALESTVKALSSSPNQDGWRKAKKIDNQSKRDDPLTASPLKDLNNENNSEIQEGAQFSASASQISETDIENKSSLDNEEIENLNEKISTLSKALATVTEEKSKMEAAFQADKKLAIVSRQTMHYLVYLPGETCSILGGYSILNLMKFLGLSNCAKDIWLC